MQTTSAPLFHVYTTACQWKCNILFCDGHIPLRCYSLSYFSYFYFIKAQYSGARNPCPIIKGRIKTNRRNTRTHRRAYRLNASIALFGNSGGVKGDQNSNVALYAFTRVRHCCLRCSISHLLTPTILYPGQTH